MGFAWFDLERTTNAGTGRRRLVSVQQGRSAGSTDLPWRSEIATFDMARVVTSTIGYVQAND
jgi:hypothetical protein